MATKKIRKNETEKDFQLRKFIETKNFNGTWIAKKTNNPFVQSCLANASKKQTNERGEPDLIYINENSKLLILLENKDSVSDHESKEFSNIEKYAVDGVKWYLSFFKDNNLSNLSESIHNYFYNWKILGIAASGDINNEYSHRISTFRLSKNEIIDCKIAEILNEDDYLSLFQNIDKEKISNDISKSSIIINKKLRDIDSQKRPILLSALMICLYDPNKNNDFKNTFQQRNPDSIADDIPTFVEKTLKKEGLPQEKIHVLINELAFLKTDIRLRNSDTLKEILIELQDNVIPLFEFKSSYDIIGKFYEEFLRFAGITNVKKGIVLTPHHITELFTELIPIKYNDCIIDCCCGTGAFLIAAMNKIISTIDGSNIANKKDTIKTVKSKQLIGFESNSVMYTLAISNMLFRGDGKSQIFHEDFFSQNTHNILTRLKEQGISPTIGFINPPYGGKDNKDNPTKKEIQFIEKLADIVSRYLVVIAPLSTFFNDDDVRDRILSKHTLKYVINMPKELFMPNAATNTAIAVLETHSPHGENEVILYDMKDDGFVLSKNRGRTDIFNLWNRNKKHLLNILNRKIPADGINIVYQKIKTNDEWLIQAHSKTDYSKLDPSNFSKTIKEYIIFALKDQLGLVDKDICEIDLFELIGENITKDSFSHTNKIPPLNTDKWKTFKLGIGRTDYKRNKFDKNNLFVIDKGERIVESERIAGDVPLITASSYNNGRTSIIDKENALDKNKMLCKNRITIDMFCNVFYHQYEYFSDDNVHTLSFINPEYEQIHNNIYVNMFILSILSLFKPKFDFGRQVRLKRLDNIYIKLPVKKDNTPDWKFMETFIKALPYSSNL